MSIIGLIAAFLPVAMKLYEDLFPAKGSGTVKKQNVVNDVAAGVAAWAGMSKGGQAVTAQHVQEILAVPIEIAADGSKRDIVDIMADRLFPNTGTSVDAMTKTAD